MKKQLQIQFTIIFILTGCASRILQYEGSEKVLQNHEFEEQIKVTERPAPTVSPTPSPQEQSGAKTQAPGVQTPGPIAETSKKSRKSKKSKESPIDSGPRQPRIEDDEGFSGRRPLVDPFVEGEEIVLDISYFGVSAGQLSLITMPSVDVNGQRAYRFRALAKTVSVFEMVYKVDDIGETLVDYHTLRPFSYTLNVKESKLLRDARGVQDWEKKKFLFWDKQISKDKGVEEKRTEWDMPDFSQNIFSVIWYLRNFQYKEGKKIKFWVSHENENLLITLETVKKEILNTDLGKFETYVVKPSAQKDGKSHSIGENTFWLTADQYHRLVRVESKIKLGTLVGSLSSMKPLPESVSK